MIERDDWIAFKSSCCLFGGMTDMIRLFPLFVWLIDRWAHRILLHAVILVLALIKHVFELYFRPGHGMNCLRESINKRFDQRSKIKDERKFRGEVAKFDIMGFQRGWLNNNASFILWREVFISLYDRQSCKKAINWWCKVRKITLWTLLLEKTHNNKRFSSASLNKSDNGLSFSVLYHFKDLINPFGALVGFSAFCRFLAPPHTCQTYITS